MRPLDAIASVVVIAALVAIVASANFLMKPPAPTIERCDAQSTPRAVRAEIGHLRLPARIAEVWP